jgi:uncharacterized membrane protein YoaK (UPF0700 family)
MAVDRVFMGAHLSMQSPGIHFPMDVELSGRTQPTRTASGAGTHEEKRRPVFGILTIPCLFAIAGGYMDAYTYLAHGHVFANAQTGNFVLLSVAASQCHWSQAVRHLPPIGAFALGVAVAQWLSARVERHLLLATLLCEAFELAILSALAAFGAQLPDATVVPMISFVAALQTTSYKRVGPWTFSSAVATGNLRDATSGLVLWSMGRESAVNRRKAVTLGSICFSFLVGALCGGIYTAMDSEYALVPCIGVVAAGLILTYRESRRAAHTPD